MRQRNFKWNFVDKRNINSREKTNCDILHEEWKIKTKIQQKLSNK